MDLKGGYFDLSPEISEETAVFPGDTAFRREILADFRRGDSYYLSTFRSTPHLGAHADAPSHYAPDGAGIGDCSLEPYLGRCQVLEVQVPRGARIGLTDLGAREIRAPRVLFRTCSYPDPKRWTEDFNSFEPELIRALSRRGVILIGIDTPSLDPATDTQLPSHAAIRETGMRNLEGLVLTGVPEGLYTLIALPLRIRGGDASPVRAILLPETSS